MKNLPCSELVESTLVTILIMVSTFIVSLFSMNVMIPMSGIHTHSG